ncbi:STAS domain-containing protein [Actinoplanes sp. NBC_00393]|uniref:STAS domain-containing protein n=1 Tax=Actinoplanes sp. NBC_00393 TaxID=2975953 RepID=UPI002E1FEEC5
MPEAKLAEVTTIVPRPADDDFRQVRPIRVEVHDSVAFVAVHGAIQTTTASTLRDILTWAVGNHSGVVVDLSAAETIDRHGLSVLIQAQDVAHAQAVGLCFAEPSKAFRTALRALQADAMFVMFERCSDGFASVRDRTSQPDRRSAIPSARLPFAAAVLL